MHIDKVMINDKDKISFDDKSFGINQSLKYAEDLAKVYQEEKFRRKELEVANEKIRAIINSMSDGMIAVNEDLEIFDSNDIFCSYLEVSKENVIGKDMFELLDNPLLREKISEIKSGIKDKDVFEIEIERPQKRQLDVFVSRIKNDNGYLLVLHDITAEKRAENLKNEFLNIITHELRTPLNAIIGFSDLLSEELEEKLDEDQAGHFDTLKGAADKMLKIVDELINYATLGKSMEILQERINLSAVIKGVITELDKESAKKSISLIFANSVDEPIVTGSESRLNDLFHHVIHNAVSFGKENGEVNIKIDKNDAGFDISVEDDGEGIPSTDLEKVFDTFYQVEEQSIRKKGGLGLGLALAKRITELHSGTIKMESELGKGTICHINLPTGSGANL